LQSGFNARNRRLQLIDLLVLLACSALDRSLESAVAAPFLAAIHLSIFLPAR
jgi:hypothetical protein